MYPLKNLRRRAARTVLVVIGVTLAITLTTIMFAISEGINSSTKELIDETRIDLFVYPKDSNPILQEFSKYIDLADGRDLAGKMLEGNPKIRAASPWLVEGMYISTGELDVTYPGGFQDDSDPVPMVYSITAKGYVPAMEGDFGGTEQVSGTALPTKTDPFYANGTYDSGASSDNFTHEILLNKNLADRLEVSVGDTVYIHSVGLPIDVNNVTYTQWQENATWYKVHGIILELYEPRSILSVTMHLSELQYLSGKHKVNWFGTIRTDLVNEIYVDLHDPDDKAEVKRWLEEDFEDRNKITVVTSDELAAEFNSFLDIFKGFSNMIVIITSCVVVLFISTIMMISVREQGREIGMMRAIGISRTTIVKYILAESLIICILGFIFGVIFGFIGANILEDIILNAEDEIPVGIEVTTVTTELILQVSAITIFIGILASIIPAAWSARLQPVESIRKV
ncbi:MAG: ABC transporter permease [Thermoplasmata archaeon]|nr:MAG: ABC transporter permease [Thermoplasmata archaeon]